MCYTSGTTGHPKGVVYSHRAVYLHCLAMAQADTFALSEHDVILHVVPMFHANAWCVPYAGLMVGATQLFAGPHPQPRDIVDLIEAEQVHGSSVGSRPPGSASRRSAEREGRNISSVRCIPIGGSAAPKSLIEAYDKQFGARILQAWGMTETTPIGTVSRLKSYMEAWREAQQYDGACQAGLRRRGCGPPPGGRAGMCSPLGRYHHGRNTGSGTVDHQRLLSPRGARPVYRGRLVQRLTGDIATIDPEGYVQIMDRTKDIIKSGGEWIEASIWRT